MHVHCDIFVFTTSCAILSLQNICCVKFEFVALLLIFCNLTIWIQRTWKTGEHTALHNESGFFRIGNCAGGPDAVQLVLSQVIRALEAIKLLRRACSLLDDTIPRWMVWTMSVRGSLVRLLWSSVRLSCHSPLQPLWKALRSACDSFPENQDIETSMVDKQPLTSRTVRCD